MPTNLLGIVLVSLLMTGCTGPQSLADRAGKPGFDNARLPVSGKDSKSKAAADHDSDTSLAEAQDPATIGAPSPSVNRDKSRVNEISIDDLLRMAREEVDIGHPEAARIHYEKILAKDSRNSEAHHGLAVIADNARDFASAEKHYQAAIAEKPADVGLLSDLGYSYLLQNKLDESVKSLTHAVQLQPSDRQALNNLGLAYAMKKDSARSFEAFRQADGDEAARTRIAQLFPNQPLPQIAKAEPTTQVATDLKIVPQTTLASDVANSAAGPVSAIVTASADGAPAITPNAAVLPGTVADPNITAPPSMDQPISTAAAMPEAAPATIENRMTDRQALLLGMNTGACGPFPIWMESLGEFNTDPIAQPSPGVAIPAQASLNSTEPGAVTVWPESAAGAATAVPSQRVGMAHDAQVNAAPPTSGGNISPNDPLASFEAEIQKRAAQDYSSQRAFRTGAMRAAARPTSSGQALR